MDALKPLATKCFPFSHTQCPHKAADLTRIQYSELDIRTDLRGSKVKQIRVNKVNPNLLQMKKYDAVPVRRIGLRARELTNPQMPPKSNRTRLRGSITTIALCMSG